MIVLDSTDTYEEEDGALSEQLFTGAFYMDCWSALSERGIVVTQADNLVFCPYSMETILAQFDGVFPATGTYLGLVPSFGGFSGFCWGSKGAILARSSLPSAPERSCSGISTPRPTTLRLRGSPSESRAIARMGHEITGR